MKKLFAAVAFIIIAVLAVPPVAAAEIPDETLGVYSVITDKDGSEQIAGAPDVDRVEESQEYNLYVGSKEALSVGASGSSDKRFHVEFMLPGTTKQVYLTGLCAENVDDIQQEILAKYIDNQPFDFEDLNFIDAEKLKPEQNDTYLCWAASCANMLTYTGWAQKAGFRMRFLTFTTNRSATTAAFSTTVWRGSLTAWRSATIAATTARKS